jgi:Zn-dependent peptidase ImmA (M78 family)
VKADNVAIGRRARVAIDLAFEGELTQAEVAARIAMTPDALSRALKGERGFASVELVQLADITGSDLHELITGAPDPHRLVVVARHSYDHEGGRRSVPGRDDDESVLRDLELLYRQAGDLPATPPVPTTPDAMRAALGDGFVRPLADRVEQRLGIDIIRLPQLSTCYSFAVDGRLVIAVDAVGNWFRENFGIAHELGHLARGHHDEISVPDRHEATANGFAAELLMPEATIRAEDWEGIEPGRLASVVWSYGVSTKALVHRLDALGLARAAIVDEWSEQSTQKLLRRHLRLPAGPDEDEITARMTEAATRRFPLALRNAHVKRIASGEIGKGALAWMLHVDPDSLEVDVPPAQSAVDPETLGDALGLTVS